MHLETGWQEAKVDLELSQALDHNQHRDTPSPSFDVPDGERRKKINCNRAAVGLRNIQDDA